jgi:hypothetical protein
LPGFGEPEEKMFIEALVAKFAVEAFDESVLHRLAGLDVVVGITDIVSISGSLRESAAQGFRSQCSPAEPPLICVLASAGQAITRAQ